VLGIRDIMLVTANLCNRVKIARKAGQLSGVCTVRLMSACAAHSFFFASSKLVRGGADTGTSLPVR
jgi:hypothetical protein